MGHVQHITWRMYQSTNTKATFWKSDLLGGGALSSNMSKLRNTQPDLFILLTDWVLNMRT